MMDEKREWCIRVTYPTGEIEYGGAKSRGIADAWAKIENRLWPNIKHEVVHVSEVPKDEAQP